MPTQMYGPDAQRTKAETQNNVKKYENTSGPVMTVPGV